VIAGRPCAAGIVDHLAASFQGQAGKNLAHVVFDGALAEDEPRRHFFEGQSRFGAVIGRVSISSLRLGRTEAVKDGRSAVI
jgi:hypothetical protein